MSESAHDETLKQLLDECGFGGKAQRVGSALDRLRWGSANVITGISGDAIIVIAAMFDALPSSNQDRFCLANDYDDQLNDELYK